MRPIYSKHIAFELRYSLAFRRVCIEIEYGHYWDSFWHKIQL
jgi:hypothetical protein